MKTILMMLAGAIKARLAQPGLTVNVHIIPWREKDFNKANMDKPAQGMVLPSIQVYPEYIDRSFTTNDFRKCLSSNSRLRAGKFGSVDSIILFNFRMICDQLKSDLKNCNNLYFSALIERCFCNLRSICIILL